MKNKRGRAKHRSSLTHKSFSHLNYLVFKKTLGYIPCWGKADIRSDKKRKAAEQRVVRWVEMGESELAAWPGCLKRPGHKGKCRAHIVDKNGKVWSYQSLFFAYRTGYENGKPVL